MADQLRWWKLWTSALDDDGLARLSLQDVARWCLLGAWLREHGHDGTATLSRPGHALATAWRQREWHRIQATLHRLPNIIVEVVTKGRDGEPDVISISMRHWYKYQEDSSATRTRRWREKQRQRDGHSSVTGDDPQTVTRDGKSTVTETEQTRRDETVPPSGPPSPLVRWSRAHGPLAHLHPDDRQKLARAAATWPTGQLPPDAVRLWFRNHGWHPDPA